MKKIYKDNKVRLGLFINPFTDCYENFLYGENNIYNNLSRSSASWPLKLNILTWERFCSSRSCKRQWKVRLERGIVSNCATEQRSLSNSHIPFICFRIFSPYSLIKEQDCPSCCLHWWMVRPWNFTLVTCLLEQKSEITFKYILLLYFNSFR